jgi:hypothetical protein
MATRIILCIAFATVWLQEKQQQKYIEKNTHLTVKIKHSLYVLHTDFYLNEFLSQ